MKKEDILIQVELNKIIIDEKRQDQIIVLKEKDGDRQLPIIIGLPEASSIKLKISGVSTPRPMTHDLVMDVIEGLGAKLDKLIIDDLVSNTFHAKLVLKGPGGKIRKIDARPSDGIALAVRAQTPIFVSEEVLRKTGIFKPEE